MKKLFIVLTVSFVTATNCFSQNNGYIAISLGSSKPIGDFASNDPNKAAAGYAKSGAIFDVSFGFKLGKNLGIAALLRGQANPTDAQAYADQISKQNPGVSGTVESKNWSIAGYMGGAYGSFPITEKLSFESKVLIGFLSATSPEMTVNLIGPGGTAWAKQNSATSSTFAYMLSTGFKFDVAKRVCMLANIDYLGANPEFSNVTTTASNGTMSKTTFSQSFGTVNIGVGVGFRL